MSDSLNGDLSHLPVTVTKGCREGFNATFVPHLAQRNCRFPPHNPIRIFEEVDLNIDFILDLLLLQHDFLHGLNELLLPHGGIQGCGKLVRDLICQSLVFDWADRGNSLCLIFFFASMFHIKNPYSAGGLE